MRMWCADAKGSVNRRPSQRVTLVNPHGPLHAQHANANPHHTTDPLHVFMSAGAEPYFGWGNGDWC